MKNILFTGSPGTEKSTLIEKLVQKYNGLTTGFITKEIRNKGQKVGFFFNQHS